MRAVTSVMSDSATLWPVAHQASLLMAFSRQEYWSGLLCLPPGDLPDLGSNLHVLHCRWVKGNLQHLPDDPLIKLG